MYGSDTFLTDIEKHKHHQYDVYIDTPWALKIIPFYTRIGYLNKESKGMILWFIIFFTCV